MQRRFTIVRLRFNDVLSQFDLFSELITQRSEHDTGVWLAGLDVLATDALCLPGGYFEPPQVVCYLARGPGAAMRRARTRIPGGGQNPVAIVRVPRERMVGNGIASSLVHEVGHQVAALLQLVELGPGVAPPQDPRHTQQALGLADLGTVDRGDRRRPVVDREDRRRVDARTDRRRQPARLGGVPRHADDPHPVPWIRVRLSCPLGDATLPASAVAQLAALWESLYPRSRLDEQRRTAR